MTDNLLATPDPAFYQTEQIWLHEIDDTAALHFHERVMITIREAPNAPIIVFINSYGGEGHALNKILDTMDAARSLTQNDHLFITCAVGKAMSAGAIILAYGDLRCATPGATIMLHQAIVTPDPGSVMDVDIEIQTSKAFNRRILEILRQRCNSKLPKKEFQKLLARNLYMSPRQALKFGVIDMIGYPKIFEERSYRVCIVDCKNPGPRKGGKDDDQGRDPTPAEA